MSVGIKFNGEKMRNQTYHFIGIGGIGMSGLARILLQQNRAVSGSDIAINYTLEALAKAGAKIYQGHSADFISPQMTVVYGSDIKADNPEYVAAIDLKCHLLHRADLLAELMAQQQALAVAGSHGKTTTSALLAAVLVEAGLDPSFAVGGILPQFQSNARFGKGQYFAFEADESDGTFLKYSPFGAIVTNIGKDHLNNYQDSEAVLIEAFKSFMQQVKAPEHLFWCAENAQLKALNLPGKQYGFGSDCDWQALNFKQEAFEITFDVAYKEKRFQAVQVASIGRYNALNALAVFGLASSLGIKEESIRCAFKAFKGVQRRCERKGEHNGVLFLDDYAHHPTEIKVTLHAIREAIKGRRLIAVFQPHRYSRTKDCLGHYHSIFTDVDELVITDVYGAGEKPIANVSHVQIMAELSGAVHYVPRSDLGRTLAGFVQPGDVVVTLGAGDVTKVGSEALMHLEALSYA
jgi:UDP-N-acetylmuramate--alanine ligase